MSPREIVDAYLEGRINSWGVYRRLIHLGLTTATEGLPAHSERMALFRTNSFGSPEAYTKSLTTGALSDAYPRTHAAAARCSS